MRASLLTIGDELLSGKTTNTNASWISQKLTFEGCNVISHLTVPDIEIDILDGISILFKQKVKTLLGSAFKMFRQPREYKISL